MVGLTDKRKSNVCPVLSVLHYPWCSLNAAGFISHLAFYGLLTPGKRFWIIENVCSFFFFTLIWNAWSSGHVKRQSVEPAFHSGNTHALCFLSHTFGTQFNRSALNIQPGHWVLMPGEEEPKTTQKTAITVWLIDNFFYPRVESRIIKNPPVQWNPQHSLNIIVDEKAGKTHLGPSPAIHKPYRGILASHAPIAPQQS